MEVQVTRHGDNYITATSDYSKIYIPKACDTPTDKDTIREHDSKDLTVVVSLPCLGDNCHCQLITQPHKITKKNKNKYFFCVNLIYSIETWIPL